GGCPAGPSPPPSPIGRSVGMASPPQMRHRSLSSSARSAGWSSSRQRWPCGQTNSGGIPTVIAEVLPHNDNPHDRGHVSQWSKRLDSRQKVSCREWRRAPGKLTLLADLHRGSDPLWVPCSRGREHGVPRLQDSLGHAHEDVSMAPKSLVYHHLRCNTWGRGGDQRGVSENFRDFRRPAVADSIEPAYYSMDLIRRTRVTLVPSAGSCVVVLVIPRPSFS